MKRTLCWALGALALLCCSGSFAAGILKLSRTELTLSPDKPASELWVENVGDTPLYLDISQQRVSNPGYMPEQLVPVEEVSQPTLLVLPNRLVLSPGQKYRMALKALSTPDEPQVWRVTFRPREHVVVDAGRDGDTTAPLFVSIGYGVVIYQLKNMGK
ncbi:hypothetical protein CFB40_18740 [Burkholderia sp. AU31652]|uniref:Pilus assembly protein n=1 Tax=Burkholderia contaminans TaxID=488447 RepID=A0A6P3AZ59_9BURK|nr:MULTISPECIES: hypothetical protein [Burkholderia]MDN7491521.1 hypothetical protein [Burkholderia sp. AU45274]OXI83158.1 hypothetical protein CFB40_18740 [Burkholderia sp. AU31652]OXJ10942.1 hypothetical protein CFB45_29080 [Burkholderia sp. HI2500]VWD48805.1 pilus assembly protein [Burkholderia contaminans]